MRIKITGCDNAESAWYNDIAIAGCIFEVTEERSEDYVINIGGILNTFYVMKTNCEIVEDKKTEEQLCPVDTPRFKAGEKVWVRNNSTRQWKNVVFRMRYDGVYWCSDIVVPRCTPRHLTGWDFICSEDAVETLEHHIIDVRDKLEGLVMELKTFKKEEII